LQYRKVYNEIYFNILDDSIEPNVDYEEIIDMMEETLPQELLKGIDAFYVGNFDFLNSEHILSKYMENAVYLSDSIHHENDMMEQILLAVSAKVIEEHPHLIYDNRYFLNEWKKIDNERRVDIESYFGEHFAVFFSEGKEEAKEFRLQYPQTYKLINEVVSQYKTIKPWW